jgi:hypothetical protein
VSAATAAKCNEDMGGGGVTVKICTSSDYVSSHIANNTKASIVFAFFTMLMMIVSTFFSWRDNANEESKK